jgi:hypothetical protein
MVKKCVICNKYKAYELFIKEGRGKVCHLCYDKSKVTRRRYHLNHITKQKKNPIKYLLKNVKGRARQYGLMFNLTENDIFIPKKCPVLGIPIDIKAERGSDNGYSIDKIIPSKGYTKGNVMIISNRANRIKGNATLEELEKIVKWLKKVQDK